MGFLDFAAPFITLGFVIGGAALFGPLGAIAGGVIGGLLGSQLAGKPATPSASARSERRLAQIADGNMPYTQTFGRCVVGYSRTWTGVGGDRDEWKGIDGILDDERCSGELSDWGVKLNDDYFQIFDNDPGSGEGMILNTNSRVTSSLPTSWLVPIKSSKYWRQNQSDKDPDGVDWHFAIRIFFGGHERGNDPAMTGRFGDVYTNRNRWYQGKTGFHAITRANTELGTPPAGGFNLVFLMRGRQFIYDWRTDTEKWTANAALVFADQLKDRFGVGNSWFDADNMKTEADACDDITWDDKGALAKYEVHDQFRDDEEDIDVLKRTAAHFGGWFFERGDKIIIATGRVRAPVLQLTRADFAEDDHTLTPPAEEDWFNTVLPSYVPRFNGEGDLHGKTTPAALVSKAAYKTEDGGEQLIVDRSYEVPFARSAKYLALRELKQRRLAVGSGGAASYSGTFKMRAMPLEIGDVVNIINPDLWGGAVQWQIVDKTLNLENWTVGLSFIRYDADVENPDGIPVDDPLGVRDGRFSGILPKISGLSAVEVPGSGGLTPKGKIRCSVAVSWTDPKSVYIDTGSIAVMWKLAGDGWPGKTIEVSGVSAQAILHDLLLGQAIDIRARGESPYGQRGAWSNVLRFTPQAIPGNYRPEGPPLGVSKGLEMLSDPYILWDFDSDVGDGEKLGTYVYSGSTGTSPASAWDGGVNWDGGVQWVSLGFVVINGRAKTIDTDGYWSVDRNGVTTKTSLEMELTGARDDAHRVNVQEFLPVRAGQVFRISANIAWQTAGYVEIRILFYDVNRTFIPGASTLVASYSGGRLTAGTWRNTSGIVVAQPIGGILPAFARIQFRQVNQTGAADRVRVDGMSCLKLNHIVRTYDPAYIPNWSGDEGWRYICSVGLPKEELKGLPNRLYADGESIGFKVDFRCHVLLETISAGGVQGNKTYVFFEIVHFDATWPRWAPLTDYVVGDRVRNRNGAFENQPLERLYRCMSSGRSAATAFPSGTGSGITDGTVVWDYVQDIGETLMSPGAPFSAFTYIDNATNGAVTSWASVVLGPTATPSQLGTGPRGIRVKARLSVPASSTNTTHTKVTIKDVQFAVDVLEGDILAAED